MSGITDATVENYIYSILPERDAVLGEIEQQAAKRNIPIVGPAVGRLLYQLARTLAAKTVFEMGSAVGYSTIWWAMAVGERGRVVYTDGDEKNAEEARGYFRSAGVSGRIDVRVGDALELLSGEKAASYDVIFNDVDKQDYPRVFRLAKDRVRKGGLFITDNVLWNGRVARAARGQDGSDSELSTPETKAILEFNRLLYASKDFFTTMLPLRDGVAVSLRL
jgi:caffeoyl-CoA O-methyltransferase